jgi:hypothetical protein
MRVKMTEESQSTAPNGGDTQPEGETGQAGTADGHTDSGTSELGTKDRDAIWAEARRKYEPLAKKAQDEAATLRKKLTEYEDAQKTDEDFRAEAEKYRAQATAQSEIIEKFAQDGISKLPDNLQSTLKKAAGDDPLRALELLPDFQELASKPTLKTLGGEQKAASKSSIDMDAIKRAQAQGNMQPYRDAVTKHGKEAFNEALSEWVAARKG